MNDATKFTLCRICEQVSLIDEMAAREPNRTLTARKIIMTRLLKEELSVPYMVRHG